MANSVKAANYTKSRASSFKKWPQFSLYCRQWLLNNFLCDSLVSLKISCDHLKLSTGCSSSKSCEIEPFLSRTRKWKICLLILNQTTRFDGQMMINLTFYRNALVLRAHCLLCAEYSSSMPSLLLLCAKSSKCQN